MWLFAEADLGTWVVGGGASALAAAIFTGVFTFIKWRKAEDRKDEEAKQKRDEKSREREDQKQTAIREREDKIREKAEAKVVLWATSQIDDIRKRWERADAAVTELTKVTVEQGKTIAALQYEVAELKIKLAGRDQDIAELRKESPDG